MRLPDPLQSALNTHAQKLDVYADLLRKWQSKINLVSSTTMNDVQARHIVDSAQILTYLPQNAVLYDLGSGAGFPGMVIAMMRPDITATLIESDQKKCSFLTTVSRETATKVKILNKRIEESTATIPAPDIITARALASLSELFNYIEPWFKVKSDIQAVFLKGKNADDEIADALAKNWVFDVQKAESLTSKEASILIVTNLTKRPLL